MIKILGKYMYGEVELVDEADTIAEANEMLTNYQLAFGLGWMLWIQRGE